MVAAESRRPALQGRRWQGRRPGACERVRTASRREHLDDAGHVLRMEGADIGERAYGLEASRNGLTGLEPRDRLRLAVEQHGVREVVRVRPRDRRARLDPDRGLVPAAAGRVLRGLDAGLTARLVREQAPLEVAHRGLLSGLGVVPAAEVQRAVGHQEPKLVCGRPAHVPGLAATPLLGLRDRPLH